MALKKSETNNKYFQDLPDPNQKKSLVYAKSKALSNLVAQRSIVLENSREIRKKLYNLSVEIHNIELELTEMFKEV